jgi:hypothetical protein
MNIMTDRGKQRVVKAEEAGQARRFICPPSVRGAGIENIVKVLSG